MSDEIGADAVFMHFPPVPKANPGEKLRITGGPPKSAVVTEESLKALSPAKRLETVLDCNDDFRLFGYRSESSVIFVDEVEKTKRMLTIAVHPDRHPKAQKSATAATQKVAQAAERVKTYAITHK